MAAETSNSRNGWPRSPSRCHDEQKIPSNYRNPV